MSGAFDAPFQAGNGDRVSARSGFQQRLQAMRLACADAAGQKSSVATLANGRCWKQYHNK
jgi:hypothetical protein